MLALWVLIQASFGVGLARAGIRASRSHLALLPVIAVLFAYWLAALINMSFDVYLEGPQGGIPFWSVIGLGMVAMRAVAGEKDEAEAATSEAPAAATRSVVCEGPRGRACVTRESQTPPGVAARISAARTSRSRR